MTGEETEWDSPSMIVTLDEKRRLMVPVALAPATRGDAFDARFDVDEDTIFFVIERWQKLD